MTPIHCPVHVDRNPSAVTIRSKRGTPGVYCSSCNASFYIRREGPFYDFDYDLKVLRDLARRRGEDPTIASIKADNPEDAASAAHSTGICFVNEPFLPSIQADADIVLIKSPKGSGKTEWLTGVVRDARQNGQSVLLIGHRQMLIMSTAKRLGLTPYITMKRQSAEDEPKIAYNKPDKHFAVCIDSLPTRLDPRINKYDVILIDEVEQVLAHLTSDTLREQRNNAITWLGHYLRQSKKAYLLDADLNRVTSVCIPELLDSATPVRKMALVVVNEYAAPKGSMQLYNDKGHLIQQLYRHLAEGKRCFVCANSRKEVNALGKALQETFKTSKKFKVITGENSQTAEAQEFLLGLPNSMLEYDCMLVSPAVGTGIDITFPNGETRIDAVFGLFSPRVNTHFDIDQQLCRVRHPGSVHVWISPQKFRFSTDRKLILSELKVSALRNGFQYAGLNADGSPIYSEADKKYMRIFSEVRAAARASKNELREHFCALRKFSGWNIDVVERNVAASKDGNELAKFGKEMAAGERIRSIANAALIDKYDYEEFKTKSQRGTLKPDQEAMMRRFEIESFYLLPISEELAAEDREGNYRECIRRYELLLPTPIEPGQQKLISDSAAASAHAGAMDKRELQRLLSKLFSSAGVFDEQTGFRSDADLSQESLSGFVAACRSERLTIERLLDKCLRRDLEEKAVLQLKDFLRLVGLSTNSIPVVRTKGTKIYRYQIDAESLSRINSHVDRRRTKKTEWERFREELFFGPRKDQESSLPDYTAAYLDAVTSEFNDLDAVQEILDGKAEHYQLHPEERQQSQISEVEF